MRTCTTKRYLTLILLLFISNLISTRAAKITLTEDDIFGSNASAFVANLDRPSKPSNFQSAANSANPTDHHMIPGAAIRDFIKQLLAEANETNHAPARKKALLAKINDYISDSKIQEELKFKLTEVI